MTVHFIGAGPGAADLVTVRARALIGRSGICLRGGGPVSDEILEFCPPGARVIDVDGLSLDEAIEACRQAQEGGMDVAWLCPGDLSAEFLAAPLRALDALAIPCTVTPGVPRHALTALDAAREPSLPPAALGTATEPGDRALPEADPPRRHRGRGV